MIPGTVQTTPEIVVSERQRFYDAISEENLTPLWEVLHGLVPRVPNTQGQPVRFDYQTLRRRALEAGDLISAEEAERRVLVLENPAFRGRSRLTNTLYGGAQMILPGEVARSHRHSQSALRFILEGEGAFTTVDGEKIPMSPGDLILTPAWCWHDHGNEGDNPVIWFDGLDIPLIADLGCGFSENAPFKAQPLIPGANSFTRHAGGLRPCDPAPASKTLGGGASPVSRYPYAAAKAALSAWDAAVDEAHGVRMRYGDPTTGGDVLPTITAFLQRLPAGFEGVAHRSTDAIVFIAVEGEGHIELDDAVLRLSPGDIVMAPGWARRRLFAQSEAILFSCSDRGLQEKLSLWREARG